MIKLVFTLLSLINVVTTTLMQQNFAKKVEYISPFTGTSLVDSLGLLGTAFPVSIVSFGFIQLSSNIEYTIDKRQSSRYDYNANKIVEFNQTHSNHIFIPDFARVLIMPTKSIIQTLVGIPDKLNSGYSFHFLYDWEWNRSGYYNIDSLNDNSKIKFTATMHRGIYGYTFPKNQASLAQTDSLTIVKAKWEKEKIAPGVFLKHYLFKKNLFSSNQNITVVEVKPRRKIVFDLAYESKALKHTSDFGKSIKDAVAAINGTFFDVKNGGSMDYLRSNGNVVTQNHTYTGGRALHQKAAVKITNGRLTITKWDGSEDWEKTIVADDVMDSGGLLLHNGSEEYLDTASFNKVRNPRSAIAVLPNKHVLLITVDGRNENSAGMSLFELQDVVRWLKAKDAINLDGGGSTTLWVNQKVGNGVINYPTDNKKWDHNGERKVANAIIIKRKTN